MNLFKFYAFMLIAIININAKSQTASEIVNKHILAIGGKEKLKQIKTVYKEGIIRLKSDIGKYDSYNGEGSFKEYLIHGKGFKTETELAGQKLVLCYTDNSSDVSGWMIDPTRGVLTLSLCLRKPMKPEKI